MVERFSHGNRSITFPASLVFAMVALIAVLAATVIIAPPPDPT